MHVMIVCSVTTLTEKITIYSTLVAILNARQYNFGEELLEVLMEDLRNALALQEMEKARILVRFLADLVNAKVVASSSIMTLFDTFITVTYEPDIPHTRSDWYVYMILSALPWVSSMHAYAIASTVSTVTNAAHCRRANLPLYLAP
ncbi:Nuclear cap-binding protein subunit 1, partial [Geodia barretti]